MFIHERLFASYRSGRPMRVMIDSFFLYMIIMIRRKKRFRSIHLLLFFSYCNDLITLLYHLFSFFFSSSISLFWISLSFRKLYTTGNGGGGQNYCMRRMYYA